MTHYRWYNSFTRRWISRDPIGEAGGINLYGYVEGNPVRYVDPEGLWQLCVSGYLGYGGGCCVGKNKDGKPEVFLVFGIGVGGGVSYSVLSSPYPGDGSNYKGGDSGFIGGGTSASVNAGPVSASFSHNEGWTVTTRPSITYTSQGESDLSVGNTYGVGASFWAGFVLGWRKGGENKR
jgi:hypothetical protein